MKKYKTVFIDLDHTLWDFEKNSHETISELFQQYELNRYGITNAENFIEVYRQVNTRMWDLYHRNKISKEFLRSGRFKLALSDFNIENESLTESLAADYLKICPQKKHLFPNTIKTLDYLQAKYQLHIITNGFVEVQHHKIRNSGIGSYFKHIHISEEIGFKKPEPEIFNYAVGLSGSAHEHCIMIGDNPETDIMGAINAGIDHILFNPVEMEVPHFVNKSIGHWDEIMAIL
jgi:putative hydrolase of the HAD superfamily